MQKVCMELNDGLRNQAKDHSDYTEKMSDSQGGRNGRWTRADRDNNLEDNIRDCKTQCNGRWKRADSQGKSRDQMDHRTHVLLYNTNDFKSCSRTTMRKGVADGPKNKIKEHEDFEEKTGDCIVQEEFQ